MTLNTNPTDKSVYLKYMIFPALYMVFIFVLSSIPGQRDKLAGDTFIRQAIQNFLHIPLFGVLAFLWMRAFIKNRIEFKKAVTYTLIITLSYAALDEFHQSFVPGRYTSFADFILDTIGCIGGLSVYRLGLAAKLRRKCLS